MEERRIANEQRLAKLQSEMNAILHAKAQDKERKLKQSEQEVKVYNDLWMNYNNNDMH